MLYVCFSCAHHPFIDCSADYKNQQPRPTRGTILHVVAGARAPCLHRRWIGRACSACPRSRSRPSGLVAVGEACHCSHMSLASDARGVSALFRLASFVLPCVQTWRSVWKTNEQSLDHCSASEWEQDATISGEEPPVSSDIEANTADLSQYSYGNLLPAILKPNGPAKDRFRTC